MIMTMKENWKPVTISGMTGILMGAGTMFASQKLTTDAQPVDVESNEQPLQEASVEGCQSFREAFQAARAELGAGGVFRWHGNIYNTYTADEWNAKTAKEQDDFAEQVGAEISAEDVDTDVNIVSNDNVNGNEVAVSEQAAETTENADDDVRVLGYGDVTLDNGRTVTVEELEVNGQRVAVIDVDQDGEADLAMTDLNNNQKMDEGEVIDLHTGEAVSFTNDNDNVEYTADTFDI
jgi:hypothetical protein